MVATAKPLPKEVKKRAKERAEGRKKKRGARARRRSFRATSASTQLTAQPRPGGAARRRKPQATLAASTSLKHTKKTRASEFAFFFLRQRNAAPGPQTSSAASLGSVTEPHAARPGECHHWHSRSAMTAVTQHHQEMVETEVHRLPARQRRPAWASASQYTPCRPSEGGVPSWAGSNALSRPELRIVCE